MTQSELSEFLDAPALYYCEFKASDIGASLYKIRDDSVRTRHFLGADNADEIEAILSDQTLNAISPKLSDKQAKNTLCNAFRDICLEIFPKWDKKTISIADSSDAKKISLHVSTFSMRLPSIAQVAVFTELVRKKLPAGLQDKEIIDNSPLLVVPETESVKYTNISNETTIAKFKLVETLLQEANIEGYSLSYPSENFPDKFPLSRISPSHCPICDRKHDSDHGYIIRNKKSYSFFCYQANDNREPGSRKPSKKLTISETVLDRERKLPAPVKLEQPRITNPNDRFVF
ncbi:unnamed protein product [Rhizophagus irregularis]|nr:unnamed protein product [Rhizophagus irregularis]